MGDELFTDICDQLRAARDGGELDVALDRLYEARGRGHLSAQELEQAYKIVRASCTCAFDLPVAKWRPMVAMEPEPGFYWLRIRRGTSPLPYVTLIQLKKDGEVAWLGDKRYSTWLTAAGEYDDYQRAVAPLL